MRLFRFFVISAVVIFLVGPLLVVGVASLNANQFLDFPVTEFSGKWYGALLTDPQWRASVSNSLIAVVLPAPR